MDKCVTKTARVGYGALCSRKRCTRCNIKGAKAMVVAGVFFSRCVTLTLFCYDIDKNRAMAVIRVFLVCLYHVLDLMPRDVSYIFKLQGLKEHSRCKKSLKALLAFFQDLQDVLTNVGKGF